MAQSLFKAGVGLADDNVSYLSGSGAPSGTLSTNAGIGSRWADISNGDVYTKTSGGWVMLYAGASPAGEIDAIETAVGLNTDGTFASYTGTNYINGATSIKNADTLLDTQIKTVANATGVITTTSVPITTPTVVDSVSATADVIKWILLIKDSTASGKECAEILASHDGYGAVDPTVVEHTVYARLFPSIIDTVITYSTTITGTAGNKVINLVIESSAQAVSVKTHRVTI